MLDERLLDADAWDEESWPNGRTARFLLAGCFLCIIALIFAGQLLRAVDPSARSHKWDGVWAAGEQTCGDAASQLVIGKASQATRGQDINVPTLSREDWWRVHPDWFVSKAHLVPLADVEAKPGLYFAEWPRLNNFANFQEIDFWTLKFTGMSYFDLRNSQRGGWIFLWLPRKVELPQYLGNRADALRVGTVLRRCPAKN